jgi:hypothetical protein
MADDGDTDEDQEWEDCVRGEWRPLFVVDEWDHKVLITQFKTSLRGETNILTGTCRCILFPWQLISK